MKILICLLYVLAISKGQGVHEEQMIHRNAEYTDYINNLHRNSIIQNELRNRRSQLSALQTNSRPRQLFGYHKTAPKIVSEAIPHQSIDNYVIARQPSPVAYNSEPQLFSVGYSIGFAKEPNQNNQEILQNYRQQRLKNGEIIVGLYKDKVERPVQYQTNSDANSYSTHFHYQQQQPKYNVLPLETSESKLYNVPYLSYDKKVKTASNVNNEPRWKNFVPGQDTSTSYIRGNRNEKNIQSMFFNHEGALSNSQEFDHTNIMEINPLNPTYSSGNYKQARSQLEYHNNPQHRIQPEIPYHLISLQNKINNINPNQFRQANQTSDVVYARSLRGTYYQNLEPIFRYEIGSRQPKSTHSNTISPN